MELLVAKNMENMDKNKNQDEPEVGDLLINITLEKT